MNRTDVENDGKRVILVISSDRTQIYFLAEYLISLYLGEVTSRGFLVKKVEGGVLPLLVITDVDPPGFRFCVVSGPARGDMDGADRTTECRDLIKQVRAVIPERVRELGEEITLQGIRVLRGSRLESLVYVPVLKTNVIRSYSTLRKIVDAFVEKGLLEGVIVLPVRGRALNLTVARVLRSINASLLDLSEDGQEARDSQEKKRRASSETPWVLIGAYNVYNIPLVTLCRDEGLSLKRYIEANRTAGGFPHVSGDLMSVYYNPTAEFMAGAARSYMMFRSNHLKIPVWGFACYDFKRGDVLDMLSEIVFLEMSKSSRPGRSWIIRQLSTHLCPRGREDHPNQRESSTGVLLEIDLVKADRRNSNTIASKRENERRWNIMGLTLVGPKLATKGEEGFLVPEGTLKDVPVDEEYLKLLDRLKEKLNKKDPYPGEKLFEIWKEFSEYISSLNGNSGQHGGSFLEKMEKLSSDMSLGYLNCPVSVGISSTYWLTLDKAKKRPTLPCISPPKEGRIEDGGQKDEEDVLLKGRLVKIYVCFEERGPGSLVQVLRSILVPRKEERVADGKSPIPMIDFVMVRTSICPFGNILLEFAGNLNYELDRGVKNDGRLLPNQILLIGTPSALNELMRDLPLGKMAQEYYYVYGGESDNYRILRRRSEDYYLPFCDYVYGCPFSRFDITLKWDTYGNREGE